MPTPRPGSAAKNIALAALAALPRTARLEQVIEEERRHVVILSEIKKNL